VPTFAKSVLIDASDREAFAFREFIALRHHAVTRKEEIDQTLRA
jgi:hypothetical protein